MITKRHSDNFLLCLVYDASEPFDDLWDQPYETIRIFGDHLEIIIIIEIASAMEAMNIRLKFGGKIVAGINQLPNGKFDILDIES